MIDEGWPVTSAVILGASWRVRFQRIIWRSSSATSRSRFFRISYC